MAVFALVASVVGGCEPPWSSEFSGGSLAVRLAEVDAGAGEADAGDAGRADAGGADASVRYVTCEDILANRYPYAPCEPSLSCSWIQGTPGCERSWGQWWCYCTSSGRVNCYHGDSIWVWCDGGTSQPGFDAGVRDAGPAGRPDAGP